MEETLNKELEEHLERTKKLIIAMEIINLNLENIKRDLELILKPRDTSGDDEFNRIDREIYKNTYCETCNMKTQREVKDDWLVCDRCGKPTMEIKELES